MDLSAYSQLQLGEPQLAYRSSTGAGRQFALTAEQKEGFRDSLVAAFDDEFAKHEDLQRVDEPGPSVLTLDIRVEDIAVTVTPNAVGRAGRAAALLEASGAAVVIIELRDSQSNAILARGVHRGTTSGGALRTGNDEMRTRFESADKVVAKWAAMARSGLENLLDERR